MELTVSAGFPYYIQLVGQQDYKKLFQKAQLEDMLSHLSEQQAEYRYQEDKWSIKQIIGHITDHERIMIYRSLRFSRNDATLLPGYDQNFFVENSRFDELSLKELLEDYHNVRQSTLSFMGTLSASQLKLKGVAWKFELAVEEFLKATIGHEIHHIMVLKEKYLR